MLEICLDLKSTENDGLGWRPGETFLRCFSSLNSSRACARALVTMAKQTACSAGRADIFCSAGMLDGGDVARERITRKHKKYKKTKKGR